MSMRRQVSLVDVSQPSEHGQSHRVRPRSDEGESELQAKRQRREEHFKRTATVLLCVIVIILLLEEDEVDDFEEDEDAEEDEDDCAVHLSDSVFIVLLLAHLTTTPLHYSAPMVLDPGQVERWLRTNCPAMPELSDSSVWPDRRFLHTFRFSREHFCLLATNLHLPSEVRTNNRTTATGAEALAIVLARLAYPSRWYELMASTLPGSRKASAGCAIFNALVNWLLLRHRHRIYFNRYLVHTRRDMYCDRVEGVTGVTALRCWAFLDGTVRACDRPSLNQSLMYNGKDRVHATRYQSVCGPDGIILSMIGQYFGRRHDQQLYYSSGLNPYLERHFEPNPLNARVMWADKGYKSMSCLWASSKSTRAGPPSADKQALDLAMDGARRQVEYAFGRVLALWAFVDFRKKHKPGLSAIGDHYLLAVFFTNCKVCLEGYCEATIPFACEPPTIGEYLHLPPAGIPPLRPRIDKSAQTKSIEVLRSV